MTDPESVAGAVKAVLVQWGVVAGRIFRDQAPTGATLPYVTFFELPGSPILNGDAAAMTWTRGVQFSLWQTTKDESRTLTKNFIATLNGARLVVPGVSIYGCRVADTNRIPDPSAPLVQDAVTLQISHDGSIQ